MKVKLPITIVVIICLCGIFLHQTTHPFIVDEMEEYIEKNETTIQSLFTRVFDEAKMCNSKYCNKPISWNFGHTYMDCISPCHQKVKSNIYKHLGDTTSLSDFPSTYFIRIKNRSSIEKLFLSGEYRVEQVRTPGERKVLLFLLGERPFINLVNWRLNDRSNMIYLNDFFSEAEFIFPVKKDGKIVGAIVRVYGD